MSVDVQTEVAFRHPVPAAGGPADGICPERQAEIDAVLSRFDFAEAAAMFRRMGWMYARRMADGEVSGFDCPSEADLRETARQALEVAARRGQRCYGTGWFNAVVLSSGKLALLFGELCTSRDGGRFGVFQAGTD